MKVPIDICAVIDLDAPTLPAVQVRSRCTRAIRWRVWCPYCKAWHYHGPGAGHRESHCTDPASPYLRTGYNLARAVAVLLALIAPASAEETHTIIGKVVGISDGDTIKVLDGKSQVTVRLNGIDAPEHNQPFGSKSKEALAAKVFGREVKVLWREKDKYGRTLGHIMLESKWINKQLIAEGWAWHYKQYSHDSRLAKAEDDAKAAKLGLWSDAHPQAPWNFRHAAKPKKRAA